MAVAIAVAAALHATGLIAATGRGRVARAQQVPVAVLTLPARAIPMRPSHASAAAMAGVASRPSEQRVGSAASDRPARRRMDTPAPATEGATPAAVAVPFVAPAVTAIVGERGGTAAMAQRGGGQAALVGSAGERGVGATAGTIVGGEDEETLRRLIRSRVAAHKRYPALAVYRGVEGTVGVRVAVRADGSVDARVVRGADPMLDEAALEAVRAAAPLPMLRHAEEIDLDFRLVER